MNGKPEKKSDYKKGLTSWSLDGETLALLDPYIVHTTMFARQR